MAHVYNAQLDAFSLYHEHVSRSSPTTNGPALPALGHAIAGATGTAISNLCIYPLDLIITRLQVQRQLRASSTTASDEEYDGVLDAATKIYTREGGISGFYAGIVQDTGKSIADSFLFFLFYNYIRQSRLQKHGPNATNLPVLDELGVGALAGACSKLFTTPIANIVTRKQTANMLAARSSETKSSPSPSVSTIAAQIRKEKGVLGFWSGYSASLVLTLNPSITFFLYESFKRYLLPRSKRDDPGARVTFLMAAVSKAIASSITYPFSLAKSRAQTAAPSSVPEKDSSQRTSRSNGSTVFATILQIYRTDGPAALYEGILGEICRGFFSHGITMIVKEAVHKFIIQLYFLLNRTLQQSTLSAQAADMAQGVREKTGDAYERASVAGYEAARTGTQQAGSAAAGASDAVSNAASTASEAVESAVESTKAAAGDAYERASVLGYNAAEAARKGGIQASESAGNVVQGVKSAAADAYERASLAGYSAAEAVRRGGEQVVGAVTAGEGAKAGNVADAYERASLEGFNATASAKNEGYATRGGGGGAGAAEGAPKKISGDAYERASVAGFKASTNQAKVGSEKE